MSHFIVSIPSGGLSDRPPESNVTPLPTSASSGASASPRRGSEGSPAAARDSSRGPPPAANRTVPASSRGWSQISISSPHSFGNFFGLLGERFGIHSSRRFVDQLPREVDAFAEDLRRWRPRRRFRRPRAIRRTACASFRPCKNLGLGSRRARRRRPLRSARPSRVRRRRRRRGRAVCRRVASRRPPRRERPCRRRI